MNEVAATSEFEIDSDKNDCVLMDIKGMFNRKEAEECWIMYIGGYKNGI